MTSQRDRENVEVLKRVAEKTNGRAPVRRLRLKEDLTVRGRLSTECRILDRPYYIVIDESGEYHARPKDEWEVDNAVSAGPPSPRLATGKG